MNKVRELMSLQDEEGGFFGRGGWVGEKIRKED